MEKRTILSTLSIMLVAISMTATSSVAETNLINSGGMFGPLKLVHLDPAAGRVGESQDLDIVARFYSRHGSASINSDGSVIATNHKVVRWGAEEYQIVDIPYGNQTGYDSPRLDETGRILVYQAGPYESSSILVFDTEKQEILSRFDLPWEMARAGTIISHQVSADASTVVYNLTDPGGHQVFVLEWKDGGFSTPMQLARVGRVEYAWLASSGDLFFLPCGGATRQRSRNDQDIRLGAKGGRVE